ncbi:MAG TPA: UbiA family prenyltransferase [Methylocella sp.]|nr:UbiA family prenyltransferase [Methylocella sp.]
MSQYLAVLKAKDNRTEEVESVLRTPDATTLVIDLDGSLVQTDMLYESFFATLANGFGHYLSMLLALRRGKAHLKAYLADAGPLDCELLPYNDAVLEFARIAKAEGRSVYLATASDQRHADAIAEHLGIFDGVFASDGATNLAGEAKARRLVGAFGEAGFDYIGNSNADIAVWAHARKAYVVGATPSLLRKTASLGGTAELIHAPRASLGTWVKALRVHQYVKNTLVFVPLLTAHAFAPHFALNAALAFIAFSLCASSVYLLNDLVDLDADRRHPTKRKRPLASGAIPLAHAAFAIPLLFFLAFSFASLVSLKFAGTLAAYFALTLAYSLSLKRKLLVDVVVLAMLYTTRVIAGAVALPVVPSEWLLAFSMLVFTCLALIKRYVELALRIDKRLPDPSNRNYRLFDLPIVGALAAASCVNAVTVFALYVSSSAVQNIYRYPQALWLICPILLYWLGRAVILAHRRAIDDDPIVFALRDRNSYLCGGLMILIVLCAI